MNDIICTNLGPIRREVEDLLHKFEQVVNENDKLHKQCEDLRDELEIVRSELKEALDNRHED